MHELPVTEGILKVALEAAGQAGARQVTAINLVVGDIASIVDDSVQFYFEILSQNTIAEGAELRFRRIPATVVCLDCRRQSTAVLPLPRACPACGSAHLQVSGGREFYVESIEVENEDPGSEGNPQRE